MNHWIVAPVVLPLFAGAALLLLERVRPGWQAGLSLAATLAGVAIALGLAAQSSGGQVQAYLLGNWPAPFGIALALDRLAALMLLLTALLALACLSAALARDALRGGHFHALFQFQLMGLNGAFLTADLFNLFVFFEVLLAASYSLLLHGGGGARLRAAVHYVALNLAGSALFLIAVSLIYGLTGTLNLADLAQRAAALAPADRPLFESAASLLLVVFALKAALLPLFLWLPGTYGAAPGPVAALFAVMTKVGAYSVVRVFSVLFEPAAGNPAQAWLVPLGLLTVGVAAFGALAATRLRDLASAGVIVSAGTLLAAIGLSRPASLGAALYYLAHSTLAGAALFLIADAVGARRGAAADRFDVGAAPIDAVRLGVAFFLAAVLTAGLPPLSGFVGKLLILDSVAASPWRAPFWGAVLGSGLLLLLAFARGGSRLFWKAAPAALAPEDAGTAAPAGAPIAALIGVCIGLAVFAAPVHRFCLAAAEQVADRDGYVRAVLEQRPVARQALRP